jgi:hypothetical protein
MIEAIKELERALRHQATKARYHRIRSKEIEVAAEEIDVDFSSMKEAATTLRSLSFVWNTNMFRGIPLPEGRQSLKGLMRTIKDKKRQEAEERNAAYRKSGNVPARERAMLSDRVAVMSTKDEL